MDWTSSHDERLEEYLIDGEYLGGAQFDADGRLILAPRDDAARARLMETIDRVLGASGEKAKAA